METASATSARCRKVFTDARDNTLDGMYLPVEKAEAVLAMLLEGASVSTVERLTGVHHTTISKLLLLAGERCERILGKTLMGVPVRDVQADEIWSFVGKKEKRRRPGDDPTLGDCYTFIAMETHSKLILNVAIGRRDQGTTNVFIEGLRMATSGRFQITTDGFAPYRSAISNTLEDRADFAQLIKVYALRRKVSGATAPPKWSRPRLSHASATLIPSASALRTLSDRTSRFVWECADSLDSRMLFRRASNTTVRP